MKEQLRKTALVTGGAQGIGKAIAQRLLSEDYFVALVDSDAEAGREAVSEFGSDALFIKTDVSKESQVKQSVMKVIRTFGRLDVLVNNAGISDPLLPNLDVKVWNKVLAVNLTGAFLFVKYALPHLRKAQGSIINIASTRALMSEPDTEAYSASKGGLVALTHSLAISYGPDIRVNCISPGWIAIDEWKKKSARKALKLRSIDNAQHPVGRVGRPEDIAELAVFLASPEAGFITGQNYVVDGGMTRKMIYEE